MESSLTSNLSNPIQSEYSETPDLFSIREKIKKMKTDIEKRLNAYADLKEAIDAQQWEQAYRIAHTFGIDIYDPFSSIREARDAVRNVEDALVDLKEKKDELQKDYREIWSDMQFAECLIKWNISITEFGENFDSDSISRLKICRDEWGGENQYLKNWADYLEHETQYFYRYFQNEYERKEEVLMRLKKIQSILLTNELLSSDDFVWLSEIYQSIPESKILARLYYRVEDYILTRPNPELVGSYQHDIDEIEENFWNSNKETFAESLLRFKDKLRNEKIPVFLKKIYQIDLLAWENRLILWGQALSLLDVVQIFEQKISKVDAESSARAWTVDGGLIDFSAALLDLRTIPPEIFAMKYTPLNTTLGDVLKMALQRIAKQLDQLAMLKRFASPNFLHWGTKRYDDLILDEVAKNEWKKYLMDLVGWIKKQQDVSETFKPNSS